MCQVIQFVCVRRTVPFVWDNWYQAPADAPLLIGGRYNNGTAGWQSRCYIIICHITHKKGKAIFFQLIFCPEDVVNIPGSLTNPVAGISKNCQFSIPSNAVSAVIALLSLWNRNVYGYSIPTFRSMVFITLIHISRMEGVSLVVECDTR